MTIFSPLRSTGSTAGEQVLGERNEILSGRGSAAAIDLLVAGQDHVEPRQEDRVEDPSGRYECLSRFKLATSNPNLGGPQHDPFY